MRAKIFLLGLLLAVAPAANAQWWALTNQATQMAENIVTGGMNYRGYVDASYLAGIGNRRADVLGFSTTQGIRTSRLFFMGVGLGVDVMFANVPGNAMPLPPMKHDTTKTGVAIPMFTDFRFSFGQPKAVGGFVDLKIGASFLTGNKYIQVGDGYILNSQCFYLKPSIGMRVPLSSTNPKLAFNVSLSYQLMTSSTWYMNEYSTTLNALGVNLGFEW